MNVAYFVTTHENWKRIIDEGYIMPRYDRRTGRRAIYLGKVSNDRWMPGLVCLEVKFKETPEPGNPGPCHVVFEPIPVDSLRELKDFEVKQFRRSVINGVECY